jgi:hypothetical protein
MAGLPWLQHGFSCTTFVAQFVARPPKWLHAAEAAHFWDMCLDLLCLNWVGIKLHGRLEAVEIHVWFLTNHGLPLKGGCPNTKALFDS